jgi:uncharacterized repeat protein (TIGR03803 family)
MASRFVRPNCSLRGVAFLFLAFATSAVPQEVSDQSAQVVYQVLRTFQGGIQGSFPGPLVLDSAGNLFGLAAGGGNLACNQGAGCGLVFKLDPTGVETVLHAFTEGSEGEYFNSGLAEDSSNVYGTSIGGGTGKCYFGTGCGVVFKVDKATGQDTVLYRFSGGTDGADPYAPVILDAAGNLYGTTGGGGIPGGGGTVFKLDPGGHETVLYSFSGKQRGDGSLPTGRLIRDQAGNLYGTTIAGGSGFGCNKAGCGIVFKVAPSGMETVLYRFSGGADGSMPSTELIRDSKGNLYGTTFSGGSAACHCGTIFKIGPLGNESVLHSFTGGADGEAPSAGLVPDSQGNLYGTASSGGNKSCLCGTVFKLEATGQLVVLHTFTGGADGAGPAGTLARDAGGNLYGSAGQVVFKLTP